MAWERRGSGLFFYRVTRVHGRPHREYLGQGEEAEKAAAAIANRKQEQQARKEDSQRHRAILAPLDELARLTDLLARTSLFANGYDQRKGSWRRRRESNNPGQSTVDGEDLPTGSQGAPGEGQPG